MSSRPDFPIQEFPMNIIRNNLHAHVVTYCHFDSHTKFVFKFRNFFASSFCVLFLIGELHNLRRFVGDSLTPSSSSSLQL